jgi:RNA polymerase sigma-70 factor (ECF subfamily)
MQGKDNARTRFNRLVGEYSKDVFRYAFWLCRDKTMAEELSQETFMRAWKSIDSLQDDKAAKSWLFTIVRRENARQYERKRLDMVDDVDFDRVGATREEYDTSTEAFVLRRALAELPEEYREPLVLQVIGGYSTEEIANQLGIKAGAVMTRLFRARKKLREMLGEREQ